MYTLLICKRNKYIEAWKTMYKNNKNKFNDSMFDGINPMLNKIPLKTEIDNVCAVLYDNDVKITDINNDKTSLPIGIFSIIITKNNNNIKPIGKQFIVDPDYQRKGLGKALLLSLEMELKNNGYTWYYIGCSNMSSRIQKQFGAEPYQSDDIHDLYKYNIDLDRKNFDEQYNKYLKNRNDIKIIYDN